MCDNQPPLVEHYSGMWTNANLPSCWGNMQFFIWKQRDTSLKGELLVSVGKYGKPTTHEMQPKGNNQWEGVGIHLMVEHTEGAYLWGSYHMDGPLREDYLHGQFALIQSELLQVKDIV